jgi:hypothetical protein
MNLFMFWKNEQGEDELITAPLDGGSGPSGVALPIIFPGAHCLFPLLFCKGTILAGVTRKSILDLAREVRAAR